MTRFAMSLGLSNLGRPNSKGTSDALFTLKKVASSEKASRPIF